MWKGLGSPAVLSTWHTTLKSDEEKSKHVSLAQQNGLAKAVQMPVDCYSLCDSDWAIIMIGLGGLLLLVSHLFAVPEF